MRALTKVDSPQDNRFQSCDLVVAGGGVTGITTALVLQALGARVAIATEQIARDSSAVSRPMIATDFAMASAYPHNLKVDNLEKVSDDTQMVFSHLESLPESGIHVYEMFEVFEKVPDSAPLADRRINFRCFEGKPDDLKTSLAPPCRPGADYIWGWAFDTYFADMPQYVAFLWERFFEQNGVLIEQRIVRESIASLAGARPLINCLGIGSLDVFDDVSPLVVIRGHQALVPGAPVTRGNREKPVAYNYTPTADVFSRADGQPEYVHFFPRSDGWVLGQTREPGKLDEHGEWIGDSVLAPDIRLADGKPVPAPIVELNKIILEDWLAIKLDDRHLLGREGYRYYRDPQESGVRIEADSLDGTMVVHNYGHAGSGITMSWGCALVAARALRSAGGLGDRAGSPAGEFEKLIASLANS